MRTATQIKLYSNSHDVCSYELKGLVDFTSLTQILERYLSFVFGEAVSVIDFRTLDAVESGPLYKVSYVGEGDLGESNTQVQAVFCDVRGEPVPVIRRKRFESAFNP